MITDNVIKPCGFNYLNMYVVNNTIKIVIAIYNLLL